MSHVTVMPRAGDWTADDLDDLPDDGLRYELVDGVLLVSPSPSAIHQVAVVNLVEVLLRQAPPEMRVLTAPLDVRFSPARQLQPDVLVVPREAPTLRLERQPLLVVEVLSASSRATDLTLKRHVYEQAGVPSYWLLDTDAPSLTVLELQDGAYVEVASSGSVTVQRPFPVTLVPEELVR